MTIKALREIDNHPLKDKILERFYGHNEVQTFCRFTLNELKQLASHEQRNSMRWGLDGLLDFSNSLTQTERSEINILQRYTRKEKLEGLERRVKSSVQRTERYLKDIVAVVEKESELQQQIDDLQTARTQIGQPKVK